MSLLLIFLGYNATNSQDGNIQYALPGYGLETDYRQQVVAVGTPLPTASLPFGESNL